MSKLLIALLALDIGVSLSKVFIFTWKLNYLASKRNYFPKNRYQVCFIFYIYTVETLIK